MHIPAMMIERKIDELRGERIKYVRKEILGLNSQEEFAERIGDITRGAVGNWERGKEIGLENLIKIADLANIRLEWLAYNKGAMQDEGAKDAKGNKNHTADVKPDKPEGTLGRFQQVRVIGSVKASSWQDVTEQMTNEEPRYVPSASDYPADWQYAFTVDGPSVNKTARDGDILICVDLIKSGADVVENDLVIVERTRFQGQMLERTAKRVRQAIAGPELWPDSNDPEFQDPIPLSAAEDDEIRVSAKVIWVLRKP